MENVGLADALDHLLNRGVVLAGESTISLGNVDLIYVGLNLVLASVETLEQDCPESAGPALPGPSKRAPGGPEKDLVSMLQTVSREERPEVDSHPSSGKRGLASSAGPGKFPLAEAEGASEGSSEQGAEHGLAQLVLTLVELLRQLMERQAVRRMEGGSIAEDRVEAMGLALMELENKMNELREIFGFTEDDIQLNLGPLGKEF